MLIILEGFSISLKYKYIFMKELKWVIERVLLFIFIINSNNTILGTEDTE